MLKEGGEKSPSFILYVFVYYTSSIIYGYNEYTLVYYTKINEVIPEVYYTKSIYQSGIIYEMLSREFGIIYKKSRKVARK